MNENDFNFDNEISLMDIKGQPEKVQAEIVTDIESVQKMSLTALNEQKKALLNEKTKVMLSTDQSKLNEIRKINKATELALDVLSSEQFWQRMKNNAKTAMDFKMMSEGLQRIVDAREKLKRLDSDGQGNARKFAIDVRFEDDTGTKVDTVIKVGD